MPLPAPRTRRDIHQRSITMQAYAREDGLFDIESHLVDTKPFAFKRAGGGAPWPPGAPLHDLWLRLTVDADFVVREVAAASDVTPFGVCKETERTLGVLVGERIGRGWASMVRDRLRGAASCTHLMEMLIPLATTALQGIRALDFDRYNAAVNTAGEPAKIDSCYAYSREREVVQWMWPQHFKGPSNP
jgi:hypothetical protein